MRKIIVEIDGQETEYDSLSDCAKALGVSVAAVSQCASSGRLCRGYVVRYADGTRRIRKRKKTNKPRVVASPKAEDVTKLIAEWYTKEWKEYVSSDALVSLIQYIKTNWKNMLNAES